MRLVLGAPPGSCSVSVQSPSPPDELMLLPGDAAPSTEAAFDTLASIDGAVLFETGNYPRVQRAGGFRCGTYTVLARWGSIQRLVRVDLRGGGPNEVLLPAPPELAAAAATPLQSH